MLLVNLINIFLNVTVFTERSARARRGGASSSGANQKRAGGGKRGEVCFEFHQFGFDNTVNMTSAKDDSKKS